MKGVCECGVERTPKVDFTAKSVWQRNITHSQAYSACEDLNETVTTQTDHSLNELRPPQQARANVARGLSLYHLVLQGGDSDAERPGLAQWR